MQKELKVRLHLSFEDHARHDNEVEFWLARALQDLQGYTDWRNFLKLGTTRRRPAPMPRSDLAIISLKSTK